MINEIDRFKKEKGRDYDVLKDRGLDLDTMSSEKISKEKEKEKEKEPASGESKDNELDLEKIEKEKIASGVPRYYFNMSSEFEFTAGGGERIVPAKRVTQKGEEQFIRYSSPSEKVKTTPMAVANPKAEYNTTPMGYYGYPLTRDFIEAFKKQRLPYMQGSTLLTIVEAIDPDGLMFLDDIEATKTYIKLKNDAVTVKRTSGDKIRAPNAFTKSLLNRKPPVTWVYDPGDGTIYSSEPCQVVFLTSKAFRVVDKLSAKAVFESLTGGEERYRDKISSDKIDPRIAYTLKNTTDPNAIAKLTQHPHPAVRTKAAFHPLAPKEYFSKEVDSIFTKLREILSNKEYSKFEGVAGDLGGSLRSSPGQDRTDVYDSLLELLDEMTPDAKGNVYVHYGLDAILEGIMPGTSVSKSESLAIRMIEDLSSNRIMTPGLETSGIVDAAISRIAKASLNNEKVLDKYFERITGKKNVQYTFEVFFKIVMEGPSKISKLKALKAFAATKSLPSLNNIGSRLYMTFAEIAADIFAKPSPKEYDALIDTAKVILDSDKVSTTMFELANKVLLKDKENKSGTRNA